MYWAELALADKLIKTIITRQIRFFGHVLRKEQLEDLALKGKMTEDQEKHRMTAESHGIGSVPLELFRRSNNREEDMIIVNVRIWYGDRI